MKRIKKVHIELTGSQAQALDPLFDKVVEGTVKNKPVMLLAQIHFDSTGAVAVCGIIDNKTAIKILDLMGKPKKPVGGHKYVNGLIKKARA